MKMGPLVLTENEMLLCRTLGNMRTLNCRSYDVDWKQSGKDKAPKYSQGDPWESDEHGVFGEYAFCKINNIFFDPAVYPRQGTVDCVLEVNGRKLRIDVKTTRHANGRLESRERQNSDVDYFVLAILTGNEVSFPGYYKASTFYSDMNLQQTKYGPKYVVTQDQLIRWDKHEKGQDNV
jgi:hypothetical protein